MTIALYDLSVRTYQQVVGAAAAFLEKGKAHCEAQGISLDEIVATRLYEDMLPFHFQVVSVAHHSMGTMRALESGEFRPPSHPETDYAGLQSLLAKTLGELDALEPDVVNGLAGRKVIFRLGDNQLPFTTENFVLSFSLPNFYFHAATAYDILRMKGAPLGKRDFMGKLRMGA